MCFFLMCLPPGRRRLLTPGMGIGRGIQAYSLSPPNPQISHKDFREKTTFFHKKTNNPCKDFQGNLKSLQVFPRTLGILARIVKDTKKPCSHFKRSQNSMPGVSRTPTNKQRCQRKPNTPTMIDEETCHSHSQGVPKQERNTATRIR